MDMNFIHCYSDETFNQLLAKGFMPLKNDNPYVLLNNKTEFDLSIFSDTVEFSDIMLF